MCPWLLWIVCFFFFSSRRRHTRYWRDWSSDVCSSDLPAVEAQAADRAHRIGQERPVMVYRLVSQGTVEEKILGLQEQKRALFEAALGETSTAAAVTRDDLLALF